MLNVWELLENTQLIRNFQTRMILQQALPVYVYSLDNALIEQFPSKTAAARWLNVSDTTVQYHIKNNTVLQGKYRITTTAIN